MNETSQGQSACRLSHGVELLFASLDERPDNPTPQFIDLVIVGSGYGGAVAAATLAGSAGPDGKPVRVCVLERGREYLPGDFPSGAAVLPGHVRWSSPAMPGPQGKREGLFDLRLGPDINAVVANGLGGGSLINAGVMLQPEQDIITALGIDSPDLQQCFDDARAMLDTPADNTIERLASGTGDQRPLKFHALKQLKDRIGGASTFEAVPISVMLHDGPNSAGTPMNACIQCGDCATGCNHNAKLSLDTNLLVKAARQGAELYTGATVLKLEGIEDGWVLHVVYTDAELRRRHPSPFKLLARKVILAAGTFGSTEILLRSRSEQFGLPPRIGQGFSGNGDMIAVAYGYPDRVNAVADERIQPSKREVGPTITGRINTLAGDTRLCIEEMAVPAALRRTFEEIATTAATLHRMGSIDSSGHRSDGDDPCAVDAGALAHSSILAVMGDDGAEGDLELPANAGPLDGDGAIQVRWPGLRHKPLFEQQAGSIPAAGEELLLPNPAWRLLPRQLEEMVVAKRGPLTTVHPLGGCAMSVSDESYVVNDLGQVRFSKAPAPAGSLVVLDGSIIPGALGVNPALTIAALALRAARSLRQEWGFCAGEQAAPVPQPVPRQPAADVPATAAATMIEVVERLSGPVILSGAAGLRGKHMLVLTIRYQQSDVAAHFLPQGEQKVQLRRTLQLDQHRSTATLYRWDDWQSWLGCREGDGAHKPQPLAECSLGGKLDFLHREASGPWRRILRGTMAWLRNRAGRDIWHQLRDAWRTRALFKDLSGNGGPFARLRRWIQGLLMLASRAGEVRRFDYQLTASPLAKDGEAGPGPRLRGAVAGHKRLTYGCLSNPWTQLTELVLTDFPGLQGKAILKLDTDFLVEENAPLLRIISQQDQPSALLDLAGMAALLTRVLLNIHMWTFRKPDAPRARTPQRLPGEMDGLPAPQVSDVVVDKLADGSPVCARLTRYRRADTSLPPVVLIHGYSTSGTAFAHPLVKPNLASHLWHQVRDVWVLDLRTSSALPYARLPWSFEDAALADIPAAIDLVCRETGEARVDLMSHCIGAAMTAMAVLADANPGERFSRERALLPSRIRRLVLSQIGPVVVFTQSNVFRAYLMHFVQNVLPRVNYNFRVEGEPTLGDEMLDRLLSSLPYPRKELAIENPWWPWADTAFTGTRHRLDALYGRAFKLSNLERKVLDNIDDFFGPLNLATVSQSIHFARRKTITNRAGRNVYVSRESLQKWRFPTLSIHGVENGLSSVATLQRMHAVLRDANCPISIKAIPGFGHQDCWLGKNAVQVFQTVADFLALPDADSQPETDAQAARKPLLLVPAAGPVWIGSSAPGPDDLFSVMCSPVFPGATHVVCVPVARQGEHFVIAAGSAAACKPWQAALEDDGWMRLSRPAAMAGPDGSLLLIAYDDSRVMASTVHMPTTEFSGDASELRSNTIQPQWKHPIAKLASAWDQLPAKLQHALDELLATVSACELEHGVLAPPATPESEAAVTFAVGSCQYPPGLLDSVPAYRSYARLASMLERSGTAPAPAFVVLAGDQIYSDASAGLFDPTALDDRYRRPYEKLFSNRHVRNVLRQCPAYMMLDDHEISDNWAPASDPASNAAFIAGVEGYRKYQRAYDVPQDHNWYVFERSGLHFFMADTRSEREARSLHNISRASIMKDTQMKALLEWLSTPQDGPKFVVSASIMGLRRRMLLGADVTARLRCDAWEGYPMSMQCVLAHICTNGIDNVVFLSGDEHLSCDLTLNLTSAAGKAVTVRSIHASPLYAPYPFANSRQEDFVASPDRFSFTFADVDLGPPREIQCEVVAKFVPGEGFALLTVASDGSVGVSFDREPAPAKQHRQAASQDAPPQRPPRSGSGHPGFETQRTDALSPCLPRAASPER